MVRECLLNYGRLVWRGTQSDMKATPIQREWYLDKFDKP